MHSRGILHAASVALAVALVAGVAGTAPSLTSPLTADDASRTYAGACVTADTPANCPANTAACIGNCNGQKAGDACAGAAYSQANPTYRKTKDAASGKKSSKTGTVLCGYNARCGPTCMNTAGAGLICPTSAIPDYVTESYPDPDSGDCAEEEAGQTEIARLGAASTSLFAASGGTFDAFAGR